MPIAWHFTTVVLKRHHCVPTIGGKRLIPTKTRTLRTRFRDDKQSQKAQEEMSGWIGDQVSKRFKNKYALFNSKLIRVLHRERTVCSWLERTIYCCPYTVFQNFFPTRKHIACRDLHANLRVLIIDQREIFLNRNGCKCHTGILVLNIFLSFPLLNAYPL